MSSNIVKFKDLQLVGYKATWDYQTQLFEGTIATKIKNREQEITFPTHNYLLFCEHPHVYTLGKTGKKQNLLIDEKQLLTQDITYYEINRGGDITYHGPGQLVVYPILDLDLFFTDIHKYMRYLEEVVIKTCAHFGVKAGRVEGLTGVWMGNSDLEYRKICAMGVKTSRWVTMHGLAFNVNTDLSYFSNIIPCGISDKRVTSLEQELGERLDMESVKNVLKGCFREIFDCDIVDL